MDILLKGKHAANLGGELLLKPGVNEGVEVPEKLKGVVDAFVKLGSIEVLGSAPKASSEKPKRKRKKAEATEED